MSDRSFKATTRVSVTVDVDAGVYGPEWKIEDIRKQAAQEAINAVECALRRDPLKQGQRMAVRSTATVSVLITEATP